jgi:hypothetical protein
VVNTELHTGARPLVRTRTQANTNPNSTEADASGKKMCVANNALRFNRFVLSPRFFFCFYRGRVWKLLYAQVHIRRYEATTIPEHKT